MLKEQLKLASSSWTVRNLPPRDESRGGQGGADLESYLKPPLKLHNFIRF